MQDGLVDNDQVLAGANPLFVVNGRHSLVGKEPQQEMQTTNAASAALSTTAGEHVAALQ
jgi:hypothetical protein